MGTYQRIEKSFWTDSKVDDCFTADDKYIYLYLLTNPHSNMVGCYELSINQIMRETGCTKETIQRGLTRLQNEHNVIIYDQDSKEILIVNWFKYNWSSSPKVTKPMQDDINLVKNHAFREYLTKLYNYGLAHQIKPNPIDADALSILYPYCTDTLSRDELGRVRVGEEKAVHYENTTDSVSIDYRYSISNSSQDELFDQLWMTYPKKSGDIRTACSEYMNAVRNGAKPEEILQAARELAATKAEEDLRYLPSLEKWLRNRAWIRPAETNPVLLKQEVMRRRAAETAAYLAEGG